MKSYSIHEPPLSPPDRVDRAEQFEFGGDGFDWNAALWTPLVLLGHRMWLALAIYAGIIGLIVGAVSLLGANPSWAALAIGAVHLIVGFEFGEVRRTHLDQNGWSDLGIVSGTTLAECERRFFDSWLIHQPLMTGTRSHEEAAPLATELPAVAAAIKSPSCLPWRR